MEYGGNFRLAHDGSEWIGEEVGKTRVWADEGCLELSFSPKAVDLPSPAREELAILESYLDKLDVAYNAVCKEILNNKKFVRHYGTAVGSYNLKVVSVDFREFECKTDFYLKHTIDQVFHIIVSCMHDDNFANLSIQQITYDPL